MRYHILYACLLFLMVHLTAMPLKPVMPLMAGENQRMMPLADNAEKAIKRVFPALVRVNVVMDFPIGGRIQRGMGSGSGAIISSDGYVVTNHHVAGNGSYITCTLANLETIEAELIGTDALSDIAVLKLKLDQRKDKRKPVAVAQWGDSEKVRIGDVVYALGSPAAVSQSVTKGIVANNRLIMPRGMTDQFKLDGEAVGTIVKWIAHDAVIFGGNSGGPLVDMEGRIIGVNEIGLGSLGGAIPSNLAREVANQLIQKGRVDRSWIGIEGQPRLKSWQVDQGVLVSNVLAPSPASEAGIKAGDVITRFNGKEVDASVAEQLPAFNNLILNTPIGQKVSVEFIRGDETRKVDLKTMALDIVTGKREAALSKPRELKSMGIVARDLTLLSRIHLKLGETKGVQVDSIRPGKSANMAKPALQVDDVILKLHEIETPDIKSLVKAIKKVNEADGPVTTLIEVKRGQEKILSVIELGREDDDVPAILARKAWLPVRSQVLTRQLRDALKIKARGGVRITRLLPFGELPLRVGDIVLKMDGQTIDASREQDSGVFANMIRRYRIGSEVEMEILREGQPRKVTVTLIAPPKPSEQLPSHTDEAFEFTCQELTKLEMKDAAEGTAANAKNGFSGLRIDKVERGGWASLAGLRGGDLLIAIQGEPTPDIKSLKAVLEKLKAEKPDRVVFFSRRGVKTRFREIRPAWN